MDKMEEPLNIQKRNKLGNLVKKGRSGGGGATGMPAKELFYCGEFRRQCLCGCCDGRCGPTNGCPCYACVELVGLKINRLGDICRKGNQVVIGGHTGISCQDLFYCNKRKNQCHCGTCGGTCGPNSGCPCFDCLELVGLSILPATSPTRICRKNYLATFGIVCFCEVCRNDKTQMRNFRGNIVFKGGPEGTGGNIDVSSNELYYCGLVHNECSCGSCDGRCGPTNGCPCLACTHFYYEQKQMVADSRQSQLNANSHNSDPIPSAPVMSTQDDDQCVVCLDQRKKIILIPCGHYAFCETCANEINDCPICRSRVENRTRVFE